MLIGDDQTVKPDRMVIRWLTRQGIIVAPGGRCYVAGMCRYAETVYKVHYLCVPCRRSHKYPWDGAEHRCTSCRQPMVFAGHDFATPPRRDDSGWAAVAAVLDAGLRYEGFTVCGCPREPKRRPRTSARVQTRRRVAQRVGVPEARRPDRPRPPRSGLT
jgi:hypothetical protein